MVVVVFVEVYCIVLFWYSQLNVNLGEIKVEVSPVNKRSKKRRMEGKRSNLVLACGFGWFLGCKMRGKQQIKETNSNDEAHQFNI